MQRVVPPEERSRLLAERGRLRFLEVESLDASAARRGRAPSGGERKSPGDVCPPHVGSGITFYAWMRTRHPPGGGGKDAQQ